MAIKKDTFTSSGTFTVPADIDTLTEVLIVAGGGGGGSNDFGTGIGVQYDTDDSFSSNVNTDIAGTDLFTADSGSPIDMDATNAGPHTGTGYVGDFLRMQMTVTDTASSGALSAETLTFSYIET